MMLTGTVFVACCLFAATLAQNTSAPSPPTMPLSYFKRAGFYNAMSKNTSEEYFDLFKSNYRLNGVRTNVPLNIDNEKLKEIGGASIEDLRRSDLALTLPHANCNPYEQVISIPNDKPNVLLYPSCVMLKQCGGCCGHPALACKPTHTQPKTVQVTKYVYDGQQAHPVERVAYIQVQEHTACQCQCKITEADCDPNLHNFDDWDCKCMCKQQQQSCSANMRWDETLCACRCNTIQNCGTGYRYNLNTCSCEAENGRSNVGGNSGVISRPAQPQQEDVQVEESTVKEDTCTHLRCPRRYKATNVMGSCRCKFSRG